MRQSKNKPVIHRVRSVAYQFVLIQAATVFFVFLVGLLKSMSFSISILLGGLSVLIPSFGFAYGLFKVANLRAARRVVTMFYIGEAIKIVLTAVLASCFVRIFDIDLLPFLIGLIAGLFGFWLAPVFVKMNVSKRHRQ